MRRIALAVMSTATGIGVVLALHSNRLPTVARNAAPTTQRTGGSSSSPTTTSPPRGAVPGTKANGTVTGTAYQYGFGVLAVRLTLVSGRITDLGVVGLRTAEPYSQSIAQQVIPILRNEVLSAQSTNVNTISGATYTSEAYLQSAQSALDKLRP